MDADSPLSAPEASVVALLSTAASVWSSVVSLTKGPSQGAGFGRQQVAVTTGPCVANRQGPGRACPTSMSETGEKTVPYPIAAGSG
ncbi:hypothetical protein GCM10007147_38670 [Nocardiopsis kunsanensis]|uniref:Uncharacterized protein n=1 Tax=Nocardiopsis kunsanensis TaxID=141693 RepID=A0A918XIZ9_9ACTN|nr:hypothetical protein GCM10007147_38670 [Nocardiopsis kunsanensis]